MAVSSVFDFHFTADHADEGVDLAFSIGADMPATAGYVRHDVVRDLADPGHVAVITQWHEQAQGEAVLKEYLNDPKIDQATKLAGGKAPAGFLGDVM